MKSRNWFWGIFFLLAAIFVIAIQIGSFGQIGFFSIAATILLAAFFIHSIIYRNFFGIFVPLALLYMIYQQPLKLIAITPWLLLLSAVLASIGFSCIFHSNPKRKRCYSQNCVEHFNQTAENIDDNNPYAKVSFGESSEYLHADNLQSGQFYSSFGSLEVFFDQAQLSHDGAEIFVDCSFGEMKLFIPRHWQVLNKVRASLGSVKNDVRMATPEEDAPKLTLTGNVQFGNVEIHYI